VGNELKKTKASHHLSNRPVSPLRATPAQVNNLTLFSRYAGAASCNNVTEWTCPTCLDPITKGTIVTLPLNVDETAVHGYIATNDRHRIIVIAFRGGTDAAGWWLDSRTWRTKLVQETTNSSNVEAGSGEEVKSDLDAMRVVDPNGEFMVHDGFRSAYMSVKDIVEEEVTRLKVVHPGYNVITTGHSLGGAIAFLIAHDLASYHPNLRISLYTYSQPRVFSSTYILPSNLYYVRVVHGIDIVPHLPPLWTGYVHYGYEFWIDQFGQIWSCGKGERDGECSNSVTAWASESLHVNMLGVKFNAGCTGKPVGQEKNEEREEKLVQTIKALNVLKMEQHQETTV